MAQGGRHGAGSCPSARGLTRAAALRDKARMRIGIYLSTAPAQPLDRVLARARALEERGAELFWLSQLYDYDSLMLAALMGRETSRAALGTWVVPTFPRHPSVLAQQALTAQAASGNRLLLGIGLSHQVVIEKRLGLDFSRPVRHMREYLEVLLPLLRGEEVRYRGQDFRVRLSVKVPGAQPPPVFVGALGPQMLRLCGRLADGVAIWLGGREYLERFALEQLRAGSDAAGRPFPRVAVGLPIAVCSDVAAGRAASARMNEQSAALPSYQGALERGGAKGPEDVSILGDEDQVRAELAALAQLGVTEFNAVCVPVPGEPDSLERTTELLCALSREAHPQGARAGQ
jgi:F420-dependent oxidoreductase-like protein